VLYLQYQRQKVGEISDERVRFEMSTVASMQVCCIFAHIEQVFPTLAYLFMATFHFVFTSALVLIDMGDVGFNGCGDDPTLQGLEMCVMGSFDGVGYVFLYILKCC